MLGTCYSPLSRDSGGSFLAVGLAPRTLSPIKIQEPCNAVTAPPVTTQFAESVPPFHGSWIRMGTFESAGQAPQLRAAAVSRLLDLIRPESGDAPTSPLRNGARTGFAKAITGLGESTYRQLLRKKSCAKHYALQPQFFSSPALA